MCPPPEVGTLGLALVEAEIHVTNSAHLWQVLFYCLPGGNYTSKALLKCISPCCHSVLLMRARTTSVIARHQESTTAWEARGNYAIHLQ